MLYTEHFLQSSHITLHTTLDGRYGRTKLLNLSLLRLSCLPHISHTCVSHVVHLQVILTADTFLPAPLTPSLQLPPLTTGNTSTRCALHTTHYTRQTSHCTLHTAHCTLHTATCTLNNVKTSTE